MVGKTYGKSWNWTQILLLCNWPLFTWPWLLLTFLWVLFNRPHSTNSKCFCTIRCNFYLWIKKICWCDAALSWSNCYWYWKRRLVACLRSQLKLVAFFFFHIFCRFGWNFCPSILLLLWRRPKTFQVLKISNDADINCVEMRTLLFSFSLFILNTRTHTPTHTHTHAH